MLSLLQCCTCMLSLLQCCTCMYSLLQCCTCMLSLLQCCTCMYSLLQCCTCMLSLLQCKGVDRVYADLLSVSHHHLFSTHRHTHSRPYLSTPSLHIRPHLLDWELSSPALPISLAVDRPPNSSSYHHPLLPPRGHWVCVSRF